MREEKPSSGSFSAKHFRANGEIESSGRRARFVRLRVSIANIQFANATAHRPDVSSWTRMKKIVADEEYGYVSPRLLHTYHIVKCRHIDRTCSLPILLTKHSCYMSTLNALNTWVMSREGGREEAAVEAHGWISPDRQS